jgi:hypothetical protein
MPLPDFKECTCSPLQLTCAQLMPHLKMRSHLAFFIVKCLLVLQVINMVYLFIYAPLQAGFLLTANWLADLNVLTTVLFFIDIAHSFIVGYQIGNTLDHVETNTRNTAMHYLRTWFLYDVIVSIPWRFVFPWFLHDHWMVDTPEVMSAMPLLSLARFATLKKRVSYFSLDLARMKCAPLSCLHMHPGCSIR